jgi:hypothetical protein
MKAIALSLLVFLAGAGASSAAGVDMRTGSFPGMWCDFHARFDLDRRDAGGRWIFEGRILIVETGEYDPLWIEQYSDNSLRIIRYLQGSNLGLTQVVQTNPPFERFENGVLMTWFSTNDGGNGLGCSDGTLSSLGLP